MLRAIHKEFISIGKRAWTVPRRSVRLMVGWRGRIVTHACCPVPGIDGPERRRAAFSGGTAAPFLRLGEAVDERPRTWQKYCDVFHRIGQASVR